MPAKKKSVSKKKSTAAKKPKAGEVSVCVFTSDGEGSYYPINEKTHRVNVDAKSLASSFEWMVVETTEFTRGYGNDFDVEETLRDLGMFVDPEDLDDDDYED